MTLEQVKQLVKDREWEVQYHSDKLQKAQLDLALYQNYLSTLNE